jgi:hypothetical protein
MTLLYEQVAQSEALPNYIDKSKFKVFWHLLL